MKFPYHYLRRKRMSESETQVGDLPAGDEPGEPEPEAPEEGGEDTGDPGTEEDDEAS